MTSLNSNLIKRIQRLPKPRRTSDALQPLFEAVSNGIHAVYEKWGDEAAGQGHIEIDIITSRDKDDIKITVDDNGIGLDEENYNSFLTTDSDHKISYGGKGVGRLLWLDCFPSIKIESWFDEDGEKWKREFTFHLSNSDQIRNHELEKVASTSETGTIVTFTGVRDNGYLEKFPGRQSYIFQHIFSHFLPVFVGGRSPTVVVNCGDETKTYPKDVSEHITRQEERDGKLDPCGDFRIKLLECQKSASASLGGNHFIHFIANDRTVVSQALDSKLGISYFGDDKDRVFHACVFGQYLDEHVNQERTGFTFDDVLLDGIVNEVCMPHVERFLADALEDQSVRQRESIAKIVDSYPSVSFGPVEELQQYVPTGETTLDAIYSHLSRQRFRRDKKQAERIRAAFRALKGDDVKAVDLYETIKKAASELEDAESRSLSEYVVRRKAVLDFMELLLERVRVGGGDSSYQTEAVLHTLICPMRVGTVGTETKISAASSHELWIIDERLTFAEYFSSDRTFKELGTAFESAERADILVFNTVHSLRSAEHANRVLMVEFKRPGRTQYPDDENPQLQVQRYVRLLQSGNVLDVKGRPIKLSSDAIFNCFIVADILGKLEEWTFAWEGIAETGGRRFLPRDGFRGSIELIGWDALLRDAKSRNQAFFDRAGISGRSFFSDPDPDPDPDPEPDSEAVD